MQQGDLRIGKRYILNIAGKPVAVYEGKHDGQLALADGSIYYGDLNTLRFRYTDKEGVERIALFDTAREVVEPEDVKVEREREEVARAARIEAATTEAKAYLTSLGLTAYESREWWSLSEEARAKWRRGQLQEGERRRDRVGQAVDRASSPDPEPLTLTVAPDPGASASARRAREIGGQPMYNHSPENNPEGLAALTPDGIENAYNGIAGRCACGCSGTHSYMRLEDAGNPADVRPKSVAATLRTIQRHADEADHWTYGDGTGGWGWQSETRLYCVYTRVKIADLTHA